MTPEAGGAPRLAFGVSGPLVTPLVSAERVRELIALALDLGAAAFDTAPFYGPGTGERRLADALRRAGGLDRAEIWTKAGTFRRPLGRLAKDFRPDAIHASITKSLDRLPRIDRLFLHGPRLEDLTDDLLEGLETETSNCRIGALGVCTRDLALAAHVVERGAPFTALMLPVHAGNRDRAAPLMQDAAAKGIDVIAIEVMAGAAASPPFPPRAPEDLWRLARAAKRRLLDGPSKAPAAARASPLDALRFAAETPGLSHILTTTTKPGHLRANAAALHPGAVDAHARGA